jgi:hypothetical protein
MNKNKQSSIQRWLPFEKIYENGIIKTKDKKYIKIVKVTPINYNLKSDLEKKSILNSYKVFLKTCQFDVQILIQSNKEDLNLHFSEMKKNQNYFKIEKIKKIADDYINYIQELQKSKKCSTKEFYFIFNYSQKEIKNKIIQFEIIENELKEKYFKIKECLSRSGNIVEEITKNEIIKLLYSLLNTRKYFLEEQEIKND